MYETTLVLKFNSETDKIELTAMLLQFIQKATIACPDTIVSLSSKELNEA